MLSILIPTFHYSGLPLAEALHEQCTKAGIPFEIICQDDASLSVLNIENEKINALSHSYFYENPVNLGRGRNINSMVSKAKYDYILLMDCDTLPAKDSFIQNYIDEIKKGEAVVFGGIVYQAEKPKQENLLRWVYGQNREALTVDQRRQNPYFATLTSNILIQKTIFSTNPFDENITRYGYEDMVWVKKLKQHSIPITHIDNPAFHLNLETSEAFIKKIHESLENLRLISNLGLISTDDNRILRTHKSVSNFGSAGFFAFVYRKFQSKIERNLLSQHPNLFLLDIYKLGYFCKINSK